MYIISEFPTLPTVKLYQIRMLANDINAFNRNIVHYDPLIFERIKRIAIQTENLNELVRNAIPMLKLKTSYIINSSLEVYAPLDDTLTSEPEKEQYKFNLLDFIENFSDIKEEIKKLQVSLRSSTDSLLTFKLEIQNQLKKQHYVAKKANLLTSQNSNKLKIEELTRELLLIIKSEEIIFNHKLSDMFDKFFPEKDLIDAINITSSKKDLLKAAIACAKRVLTIIDNGLEFTSLANVRMYLSDRINSLHENALQLEDRINQLTHFIRLSVEVTSIEGKKQGYRDWFSSLTALFTTME
ncbi:cell division protein FtsB [Providencia alcalifaciens]|nr:cell division protein FtsB [Providencia alcalifaciens]